MGIYSLYAGTYFKGNSENFLKSNTNSYQEKHWKEWEEKWERQKPKGWNDIVSEYFGMWAIELHRDKKWSSVVHSYRQLWHASPFIFVSVCLPFCLTNPTAPVTLFIFLSRFVYVKIKNMQSEDFFYPCLFSLGIDYC